MDDNGDLIRTDALSSVGYSFDFLLQNCQVRGSWDNEYETRINA